MYKSVFQLFMEVKKLKEYIKKSKLSRSDFAGKLAISIETLNSWEYRGKNIPATKEKLIDAVFNTYRYDENTLSYKSVLREPEQSYNPSVSGNKGVPYYDVDFIGGFDIVLNDQSITPKFYIDFSPFNDADFWINLTGKSMSPFISHGDIVALKKIESWKDFLLLGEIYALVTDEFRTIKIIGKGKDDDHLTLIPYNKSSEFSEQQIPKRLINGLFRVKGSIKKFF